MTMTERKVIKAKVALLELAKQLGSVTQSLKMNCLLARCTALSTCRQERLGAICVRR
jgi:hypothetical protein